MRAKAEDIDIDRVHQRTVSARGAPPLAAVGARSVFDIARDAEKTKRKARIATPDFDPMAVAIDKGVPIPEGKTRRGGKYDPLLARLTINASAAMPIVHEKSLRSAIGGFAKKHAGRKFTVRVVSETDVRVWRTA